MTISMGEIIARFKSCVLGVFARQNMGPRQTWAFPKHFGATRDS